MPRRRCARRSCRRRLPKAITIEQVERAPRRRPAAGERRASACATGAARAALRDRRTRLGGRRSSTSTTSSHDDVVRAVRQGRQAAHRAGRLLRAARDRRVPGARASRALAARARRRPRCSSARAGARLSRQSAWLVIQRCRRARRARRHPCRRTPCGTRSRPTCSQGGADVRVVQELLGHASVATTQIYTLVTVDTLREMYTCCAPTCALESTR